MSAMLYSLVLRKTETGSAGEHPVEGYHSQAHQDDERACRLIGVTPYLKAHPLIELIDLIMPLKRSNVTGNASPRNWTRVRMSEVGE